MSNVAVLLATYNGEKYIREQLDSLSGQTFQEFICYIHDDGSIDRTKNICRSFCNEHSKQFVFLDYPVTGGAKSNFFSLLEKVEADYYMFCDQDDYWMPKKIEEMIIMARKFCNADGCLIYSDLKIVDENLNTISDSFYSRTHVKPDRINYKNALVKGFIPGCAMLIDKTLRNKAIHYKNLSNIKMHDWWIVIMALLTEAHVEYIDTPLVLYRQHSSNTIGAQNLSTIDRLKFNLKRIVSGTIKSTKKQDIESPRLQAREIYETGFGTFEKKEFVRQFYNIASRKKMYRIWFYLQNFKDVYRLWWMLIWV